MTYTISANELGYVLLDAGDEATVNTPQGPVTVSSHGDTGVAVVLADSLGPRRVFHIGERELTAAAAVQEWLRKRRTDGTGDRALWLEVRRELRAGRPVAVRTRDEPYYTKTRPVATEWRPLRDDTARPVLATVKLSAFQADEAQHGIEVDETDATDGTEPWGAVRRAGGSGPGWLDVHDLNAAIYRITSSRDILRDNADDGFTDGTERRRYHDQARSLQQIVDQLVAAAGGPDQLTPETRRWL